MHVHPLGMIHPLPPSIHCTLLGSKKLIACRSDIPYAALWGDDPIPDRSHVLLATWLKPETRFKSFAEQLSTQLVCLLPYGKVYIQSKHTVESTALILQQFQ